MSEIRTVWDEGMSDCGLTPEQQQVLKRALAKMVVLGERVGVSTDQMILLLESGLTMPELLKYLASGGAYAA